MRSTTSRGSGRSSKLRTMRRLRTTSSNSTLSPPGRSASHTPPLHPAGAKLPFEQPHQVDFRQRIEMELKADHGSRGFGVDGQLLDANGEHGEYVAVRMVALRRARPSIAGRSQVRSRL